MFAGGIQAGAIRECNKCDAVISTHEDDRHYLRASITGITSVDSSVSASLLNGSAASK